MCGQGRGRTADLPIFSRTLVPTELPGRTIEGQLSLTFDMATPTGLEPATSAVTGRRANQLRYGAKHGRIREAYYSSTKVLVEQVLAYPQRGSNPCYRLERAAS